MFENSLLQLPNSLLKIAPHPPISDGGVLDFFRYFSWLQLILRNPFCRGSTWGTACKNRIYQFQFPVFTYIYCLLCFS